MRDTRYDYQATYGGAPISTSACMVCIMTDAKWSFAYSRPATLCFTHYYEWAEEKV